MDFRQLNYFVAVAEELSFSRAAQRLHISQPPLSQQIKLLEQDLGVTLLARTRRSVALTDAGALFYAQAKDILARYAGARELCALAADGQAGRLRLAFTASVPLFADFPRLLQGFRQAYPRIVIDLQHLSTGEQLQALADGRIDVGFLRPSLQFRAPSSLRVSALWEDELVVALARNHPLAAGADAPVALEALAGQPFILHPQALGCGLFEHITQLTSRAGFVPEIVQECRETSTTLALVAAELGVSIVPSIYAGIRPPGVVFRPLRDATVRSGILLASARAADAPALAPFLRYVQALPAA